MKNPHPTRSYEQDSSQPLLGHTPSEALFNYGPRKWTDVRWLVSKSTPPPILGVCSSNWNILEYTSWSWLAAYLCVQVLYLVFLGGSVAGGIYATLHRFVHGVPSLLQNTPCQQVPAHSSPCWMPCGCLLRLPCRMPVSRKNDPCHPFLSILVLSVLFPSCFPPVVL